jgi:hypothetical protein
MHWNCLYECDLWVAKSLVSTLWSYRYEGFWYICPTASFHVQCILYYLYMFHILSLPRESSKRKSSKHAGQFPQASLPSQPPEHAEQLPQASLPGPSSEHVFQACLHRYQHHIISQAVSGQARMLHKVQKYRDAGMPRLDRPRIVNRKLNPKKECSQLRTQCANPVECSQLRTQCARLAAKDALCFWYQAGYRQVCLKLRETQIDENLELKKKHLHFTDAKRIKDGYIMLKSMFGDP